MFLTQMVKQGRLGLLCIASRNPLESGQCFSLLCYFSKKVMTKARNGRNPLESGQCFSHIIFLLKSGEILFLEVAIPSNRVNVSHVEYSVGMVV